MRGLFFDMYVVPFAGTELFLLIVWFWCVSFDSYRSLLILTGLF